jgi:predicted aspartyl protease
MLRWIVLPVALWLVGGCAITRKGTAPSAWYRQADSLVREKDFFGARDLFTAHGRELDAAQQLLLRAKLDGAFNRPAAANRALDTLMTRHGHQLPDSVKLDLLRARQGNYARLFEYGRAGETGQEIVDRYAGRLSAKELADGRNTTRIWSALAGRPPQTVEVPATTTLPIIRDKAGLPNLAVRADTVSVPFIFDTGANLSTVTESTARRLGMQLLEGTIEVGSITGTTVASRLALCPELHLGAIRIRHAVFLVMPDSALAFPQIGFQIHGILGFPVIEALKEIQITRTGEFTVPATPSSFGEQNLALDFLNPVVRINGDYYTFDSGATHTALYPKYYLKYRHLIEGRYPESEVRLGGAGGSVALKGYRVPFTARVSGQTVTIDSVQLFRESIRAEGSPFYGNIGQDLVKKFHRLTLNFESMFLKLD